MKNLLVLAGASWLALSMAAQASAQAKLKIENVQAAYGQLGPERKSLDFYPFDNVLFRFIVTGAKTDAQGNVDATIKMKLVDAKGIPQLENTFQAKGLLALGGSSFPGSVHFTTQKQLPPGKYTLTVTVIDNKSQESESFERELTAKRPELKIVSPQLFLDGEGKIPASTSVSIGQVLHVRLSVIGFDTSKGKIHTEMAMQTLDADGNELLPKPIITEFRQDVPQEVQKTTLVNYGGSMAANRAGKFTMRITVTDRQSNQNTKLEVPLTVTAP